MQRDPVVARLADQYGENEALYALRCMDSEDDAEEFLKGSLERIRCTCVRILTLLFGERHIICPHYLTSSLITANLNDELKALYITYKILLSMLWQTPNALPRARRLLNTLLHAARQARQDLNKCRIRVANPALQTKVLWTPAADELLHWLGFVLSERGEPMMGWTYAFRSIDRSI